MNIDPGGEDLARRRFLILGLIRLSGVALAFVGAAITANMIGLPEQLGYVLIAVGAIDALVMPIVLSRAWKTRGP
ncbi:MAG: hypothetical protein AB7F98_07910 [Novosphingobium sp.]